MRRLRVRVFLPAEYGGGQTAWIEASGGIGQVATRRLDVRRCFAGLAVCWQQNGFLVDRWLGAAPARGWLQDEWLLSGHMRGAWRLEAVSWPMSFGRVWLRCVVEVPAGQPAVVAEQEILINEAPAAPGNLRLLGLDATGSMTLALAGHK